MPRLVTAAMALNRREPRSEVAHAAIQGIMTRMDASPQGPFLIWDLSDHGLRLWTPAPVHVGEALRLAIAQPFVVMLNVEVCWCQAAPDGSGFHVGVRALDHTARLEALHRALVRAESRRAHELASKQPQSIDDDRP